MNVKQNRLHILHGLIPDDFEYLGTYEGFHPTHGTYQFNLYHCPHGIKFAVNSFDSESDIKKRIVTCWGHE